ncbi:hypothetical protein DSECCO2_565570 [anaerobic digester metagenome]
MGRFISGSVSSKRRINFPLYTFTYSELTTIPLELPRVAGPLGFGAKRITTLPVSAPSRGFKPLSGSFFTLRASISSGAISDRRASQASGFPLAISETIFSRAADTPLGSALNWGHSPITLPITALGCGAFPYFTAF